MLQETTAGSGRCNPTYDAYDAGGVARRPALPAEENVRRKDLTPIELSKNIQALVEIGRQVDIELSAESADNSMSSNTRGDYRGRPDAPGSIERVAQRTGIAQSTIKETQRHVAAVERYPQLAAVSRAKALDYANAVKERPASVAADAWLGPAHGQVPSFPSSDGAVKSSTGTLRASAILRSVPGRGSRPSDSIRQIVFCERPARLLSSSCVSARRFRQRSMF